MRILIAILCTLAAAPAAAQPSSGEYLGQAPLTDFVIGHRLEAEGNLIEERIPRGETVQAWTRMVTVQRFAGTPQTSTGLLSTIQRNIPEDCPGATVTPIEAVAVSGRDAATMRVDCPLVPSTGRPETFVILAIEGATALHVAQVAFRRVPSAADLAWADRHLASVVLCDRPSREAVCRQ